MTKPSKTPEAGDLRERALRLLARREHSRFELARKLAQAGFAHHDIEAMLDEFEDKNWLSDRRFAESYVADHRARSGSVKLAYELRQRGVDGAIIESVLSGHGDSELERAREVWRKKFSAPASSASEIARQMRFLQNRGFTAEVIRKALTNPD
jgi:regulatory protein